MNPELCQRVSIFWDFENCRSFLGVPSQNVVKSIRNTAHSYGQITLFKAYTEVTSMKASVRSDLQLSGVSLVDCPHNGKKEVADKMMTVDMMVNVMDNPAPGTVILITGDRDFAYAVSILRMRRYRVVVIAPSNHHSSIRNQASIVFDWNTDILSTANVDSDNIQSHMPSIPSSMSASLSPGNSNPDPVSEAGFFFLSRSKRAMQHLLAEPQPESNALSADEKENITPPSRNSLLSSSTSSSYRASDPATAASLKQDLQISPEIATASGLSENSLAQTSLPVPFDRTASSPLTNVSAKLDPMTTSSLTSPEGDVPSISAPASSPTSPNDPSTLLGPTGAANLDMCSTSGISPLFIVLVDVVKEQSGKAIQVPWSKIRSVLIQRDPSVYERAGVKKFKQYIKLAVAAGVLIKGGKGANRWVSLLPSATHVDFLAPASFASKSLFASVGSSNIPSSASTFPLQSINITANVSNVPVDPFDESGRTCSPALVPERLSTGPSSDEQLPSVICPRIFMPPEFITLVQMIGEHHRLEGKVLCKTIRHSFRRRDASAYIRTGVKTFMQYVGLAVQAGVVLAGGTGDGRWMSLNPSYRVDNTSSSTPESSKSVPTGPFAPKASSIGNSQREISDEVPSFSAHSDTLSIQMSTLPSTPAVPPTASSEVMQQTHINSHPSGVVPDEFIPLVEVLRGFEGSAVQFLREAIRVALVARDPQAFKRAGVAKFRAYLRLAVAANVVILQGHGDGMWISLHPRLR